MLHALSHSTLQTTSGFEQDSVDHMNAEELLSITLYCRSGEDMVSSVYSLEKVVSQMEQSGAEWQDDLHHG